MDVTLAYNQFTGRLQVGDTPMRVEQRLAMGSVGLALTENWYIRMWGGGLIDGRLYDSQHSDLKGGLLGNHRLDSGWVISAQAVRSLMAQAGWVPFINGTMTIGWSQLTTSPEPGQNQSYEADEFLATDLRVGAIAGWTVADFFTPYASVRLFAAPFYWHFGEDWHGQSNYKSGQDVDHYAVAVGATATLPGGFRAFVDWSMLGETGLTAGLGYSFNR